jgi:predicted RNA binding protein YcfA (HicA-like mRNA interferase family)
VKYREIILILETHGFVLERSRGSHKHYVGYVKGQRKLVTADFSQLGEDILPRNLQSMIRQSGLPKKLFRG